MSGTEHPAIERTEVPAQHVEEYTPQHEHNGLSPPRNRSLSQDTLVSIDDDGPRYDTQGFLRELERGLYPQIPRTGADLVVGSTHYDGPPVHNRSFSQDTLVSMDDHGPMGHDQYPPIPQTMGSTHRYDGSPQQPSETFPQNVDGYKQTKSVSRRPVPSPERRDQYAPIQQTEARPHGGSTDPFDKYSLRKEGEQRGLTPFVSYGLALLFVFLASLGFWVQSRRRAIFFSKEDTRWMVHNPKTMTILWTSIAAFLAWCTLWLHACAVSLMARRLIIQGAKISTIECRALPSLSRFELLTTRLIRLGEVIK